MRTQRPRQRPFGLLAVCLALALWAAAPASGSSAAGNDERPTSPAVKSSGALQYLDSRLAKLAEIARSQGSEAAGSFAARNAIRLDPDRRLRVLMQTTTSSAQAGEAIARQVAELGGQIRGRVENLIEASIAPDAVERLTLLREIAWIEPAPIPVVLDVTSQGVAATRADRLIGSGAGYRPSATPIRVGILDLGFEGYERLLGNELPASVTARSFHPAGIGGGTVHGAACAEIVHDMAPDAELFLANFDSVTSHSEAVDWLIEQHVDVISYSIGWINVGPGDGRGVINDGVRRALNAGIQWVGAAGNEADVHWEATFSDTDGDGFHNYAGADEGNTVSLKAGETIIAYLSWDDWFQSNQDYDLYIVDSQSGSIVAGSTNFQNGSQPPTEVAGFTAPASGNYYVAIHRFNASRDVRLEAFFEIFSAQGAMQYIVPAGSLTIPADTDGAIAVGASYWANGVAEPFSSQGPTSDGRTKPDLSAPDGVDSASYGSQGLAFYGTSAATPHVAGAIALLKSRFGIFSFDQIVEILYGRALDRGPSGKDNQYGEGSLDVIG